MKFLTAFLFFLITVSCFSQEEQTQLPYYELPEYPEKFTAGTMVLLQKINSDYLLEFMS